MSEETLEKMISYIQLFTEMKLVSTDMISNKIKFRARRRVPIFMRYGYAQLVGQLVHEMYDVESVIEGIYGKDVILEIKFNLMMAEVPSV